MNANQKLSLLARFHLYGLHGIFTEVIYTALWDFFSLGNWKFIGVSSTWAYLIYAFSHIFIERVEPIFKSYNLPLIVRGLIYLVWTYFWEFSTGFTLSLFNACPWDYKPWFDWHFMGLITLEYAPLWFLGSLFAEKITIPYINLLRWPSNAQKSTVKKLN